MSLDDYADHLAEVAAELVTRVRDEGPDDNAAWLAAALPDPADRANLLYILAAAVPDDRPWVHLTAWVAARELKPHGTQAAAARHRYRREPLCEECRDSERTRDRARKRRQRARTTSSTTRRTKETAA